MRAEDLRIGNYLKVTLNSQTSTEGITASGIMDIYCNKDNTSIKYEPIPLTEEVLLKCGFEKHKILGSYIFNHFRFHSQRPCNDYKKFTLVTEMYFAENRILVIGGMKHLHQLQNLYFALTGEELKIEF